MRATALARVILACVVLGIALLLNGSVAAAEQVTVPDQDTPVVDLANVLDADARQQLVDMLHELKDKTGAQVKVLTVPSLAGEDIFEFAQRHYDLWKLGKKGSDKGALIVLAPTERKVRIHVGYGLEGVLPDSWCGTLSRSVAQKYFVRREFGPGLVELTQSIARRIVQDAKVSLAGLPDAPAGGQDFDPTFAIVISIMVLIFLFGLYQQWKNRGNRKRWSNSAPGWGWNSMPGLGGSSGGGWTGGDWTGGSGGSWSSGGSDFGGGGSSGGGGGGASW